MKELTAGQITEMAIKELERRGFACWRHNQIGKSNRRFRGTPGAADITGYHTVTGIRLECEAKKIGDSLSDDQKQFLYNIQNAGGYALIAHDNGNGGIYLSSLAEYFVMRIK